MGTNIANNATDSTHHPWGTTPSGNQAEEKTTEGVSLVPPEQVSPLLALPDEILTQIADSLTFVDVHRLASTSSRLLTLFNTREKLKKLSAQYYGPAFAAYRKTIENTGIPAVPDNDIDDPLLRLAYLRHVSNNYLRSESNPLKTCVATVNGHIHSVQSVTVLPGGRLASCSFDKTIKVWDLSKPVEQQCVATLTGHTYVVNSVITLPDGRLVSCSDDRTVKVWDLSKPKGQECVATLNGHTQKVQSVRVLPDGRLASCSFDRTVKVWDLSKPDQQQCVATLNGHTDWVRSVTVLPDGRLASCSDDGIIKIWDLDMPDGPQCVATLDQGKWPHWVNSVTALPDGRLASCSDDATIKVLNLIKPLHGKPQVVTGKRHTDGANSVATTTNGRQVSCSPTLKRRKTAE